MADTQTESAPNIARPTVSHMLGELTWLLSQSPTHKHFTFGDMEWMLLPPVTLEQYRVFRGKGQPIGYAMWAYLSEDTEKRLIADAENGAAVRLRPDEWKSGDRLWLIDLVIPKDTEEGHLAKACLTELFSTALKNRRVKFHKTDPDTGQRQLVELGSDG
ncbi:MAG: toxin-activating lysine-acyltransferase [Pseudomonadota bacterium]